MNLRQLFFLLILLFPFCTQAWDGVSSGKIDLIEVEDTAPYSFRIRLVNDPELCGNTNKWAYVSHDNPNYNAYVSVLLASKMADKAVTIYANEGSQNYCKIGHLQMR